MSKLIWTNALIQQEKAAIRECYNGWLAKGGCELAMREIVNALANSHPGESLGRLRMYILGIYGLIVQRDSELLTPSQCLKFAEYSRNALKLQGIDPEESHFAYMYADVYALLSQIAAESANHWSGVWHQLSATRFLRNSTGATLVFQNLVAAQRLFRVGQLKAAAHFLDEILAESNTSNVGDVIYAPAILNRLIIHRLNQNWDEADRLSVQALKSLRLDEKALLQLNWEAMCRQAMQSHDLSNIYAAIGRSGTHNTPFYIVLGTLWDLALGSNTLWRKERKLAKISARDRRGYKEIGSLFDITLALQEFSDTETPPHVRLDKVEHTVEGIKSVRTIDQEALIWLAASRALKRGKYPVFSESCFFEYRQACLRISDGANGDIFSDGDAAPISKSLAS